MDWGWYLVEKSYIHPEKLIEADRLARASGARLQDFLIEKGYASERDVYEAIAQELGLPFVDLNKQASDPAAIQSVPEHIAKRHGALPVKKDSANNVLWVAMADTSNPLAADDLRMVSGCAIRPILAAPSALSAAISSAYGEL